MLRCAFLALSFVALCAPAYAAEAEIGTKAPDLKGLVGTDGKVQDGKVQTSSGFPRLDEAALKHALRAWRFTPGTEDGKPVTAWHSVKVTFRIEG